MLHVSNDKKTENNDVGMAESVQKQGKAHAQWNITYGPYFQACRTIYGVAFLQVLTLVNALLSQLPFLVAVLYVPSLYLNQFGVNHIYSKFLIRTRF